MRVFKTCEIVILIAISLLTSQRIYGDINTTLSNPYSGIDSLEFFKERVPGYYQELALDLIHLYQKHSDKYSLQRCPFLISCSHFAERGIRKYDLLGGVIRFIDRYYYRENKASYLYYPLVSDRNSILKLDDSYYLSQEPQSPFPVQFSSMQVDDQYQFPTRLNWADRLYVEGDYERAITVYKEVDFFSEDMLIRKKCQYQLARCNLGLDRPRQASFYIGLFLSRDDLTAKQRSRGHILMGLNYVALRLIPLAKTEFRKAIIDDSTEYGDIFLSWMYAEGEEWDKARTGFESAAMRFEDENAAMVLSCANRIQSIHHANWKLPWKASMLSALFPGSGQFYSGHTVDAIQAFTFVAASGFSTWMAYRYESSFNKPRISTSIFASITFVLYTANIWGANRTAQYRNHRIKSDLLDPMRKDLIKLEFELPVPF